MHSNAYRSPRNGASSSLYTADMEQRASRDGSDICSSLEGSEIAGKWNGEGGKGSISLSKRHLDILRDSMLELNLSAVHSARQADRAHRGSTGSSLDVDIPEDIQEVPSPSPQPVIDMEAHSRGRATRPLSERHVAATKVELPQLYSRLPSFSRAVDDWQDTSEQRLAPSRIPWISPRQGVVHEPPPPPPAHLTSPTCNDSEVMQRLAAHAQDATAREARVMQHILETLKQAEGEGIKLASIFAGVMADLQPSPRTTQSEFGEQGSTAGATPEHAVPRIKPGLRLPRGLASIGPGRQGHDRLKAIVMRVLCAHDDNSKVVGLSGIALLDKRRSRIPLGPEHVTIRGTDVYDEKARLVSGRSVSGNNRTMWKALLPAGGKHTSSNGVEIVITVPSNLSDPPVHLKVWNYNGPGSDVNIGVKWMAVYGNERLIWHGVVRQGTGSANYDHSTTIPLSDGEQAVPTRDPCAKTKHGMQSRLIQDSAQHNPVLPSGRAMDTPTCMAPKLYSPEPLPHTAEQAAPGSASASPAALVQHLSDADLLAELQRRGIAPAANRSAARRVAHPGHAFAPQGARCPPIPAMPCAARANVMEGPLQSDSPSVVQDHDTSGLEAVASELVRSADSYVAQMPCLASALSEELCASPVLQPSEQSSSPRSATVAARYPPPLSNAAHSADLPLTAAALRRTEASSAAVPLQPSNLRGVGVGQVTPGALAADRGADAVPGAHGRDVRRKPPLGPMAQAGAHADLALVPAMPDQQSSHIPAPSSQATQNSGDDSDDGDVLGDYLSRYQSQRRGVPPSSWHRGHGVGSAVQDVENQGAKREPAAAIAGRRGPPVDLNQSLDSLTFFQRHNRGRLNDERSQPISHGLAPYGAAAKPLLCEDVAGDLPPMQVPSITREASVHKPLCMSEASGELDRLPSGPAAAPLATSALPAAPDAAWSSQHAGLAFLQALGESDTPSSPESVLSSDATKAASSAAMLAVEDAAAAAPWPDPAFVIPEEPRGLVLELRLFSTWGDLHYIGLSAIEIFNAAGSLVTLRDRASQVTAEPHSVNVIPENACDPRVPDNLFDGVNCTCSDLHQWLAPFTPGRRHTVVVTLDSPTTLGMLRIWNYNKSRIHSQRGVRALEILLDDVCIFQGEVGQAPGAVRDAPRHAECLLFTLGEATLRAIDRHDAVYEQPAEARAAVITGGDAGTTAVPQQLAVAPAIELVPAPTGAAPTALVVQERPRTSAAVPAPSAGGGGVWVRRLVLEVLATWGDPHYVGLTAIEVIGANGEKLKLGPGAVDANPRDLNVIAGHSGDDRTPDKLVDGACMTTDVGHMWLAPTNEDLDAPVATVTLVLGVVSKYVTAITIWNYNKDVENTTRGIAAIRVHADGVLVTPRCGVALAKAPGTAVVDFGHTLPLPVPDPCRTDKAGLSGAALALISATANPDDTLATLEKAWSLRHVVPVQQDCLTPLFPCGFILKFVIWNSWGDDYYLGLVGLEVHDAAVGHVRIAPHRISAEPVASVASLPNMHGDARTPDKLVNGEHVGDVADSWLAPRLRCRDGQGTEPVVVTAILPHAVVLSKLRVWNYVKDVERGACEVDIYLDDQLIYFGFFAKATEPGVHQSLLFTNCPVEVAAEKTHVRYSITGMERGHLTLIDERLVKNRGHTFRDRRAKAAERPATAVVC